MFKFRLFFTLIALLASSSLATADNTFPASGHVGIGTTQPLVPLDVDGKIRSQGLRLDADLGANTWLFLNRGADFREASLVFETLGVNNWTFGLLRYGGMETDSFGLSSKGDLFKAAEWVVTPEGHVGIGTYSPNNTLTVEGTAGNGVAGFFRSDLGGAKSHALWGANGDWYIRPSLSEGKVIIADNGGFVGIGTDQPEFELTVNGTVAANEIVVSPNAWPDYVFAPDYELSALSEVERFIQANGHLPGIPSQAEVLADGVNMTQMQVKLLEKVEELTLYVIELEAQVKKLQTPRQ